ncbi:MAG: hypothetical protein KAJ19_24015 [Gammaproteobacteria bacterium]|nr:hypothetical protein [Gammaproteobacteria bacterium]
MDSYALDDDLNPVQIAHDDSRNIIRGKEDWELRRRIALTKYTSGASVSTVFLGVDHNHGDGDPILFETLVFDDTGDDSGEMVRYTTFNRAITGHAAMVVKMTEKYSLTIESSYIKERPPIVPRELEYCNETNNSILRKRFTKRIKL